MRKLQILQAGGYIPGGIIYKNRQKPLFPMEVENDKSDEDNGFVTNANGYDDEALYPPEFYENQKKPKPQQQVNAVNGSDNNVEQPLYPIGVDIK